MRSHVQLKKSQMKYLPLSGQPPRVVGTDAARSTDWQNTLIAGIDAGERFILALTRPAP